MIQLAAKPQTIKQQNIVQEEYKHTNPDLKLWTEKGLKKLGQIIRTSREDQKISLDQMVDMVLIRTGKSVSKKTLGNVEKATGEPKYNTLAIIAASGIVADRHGKYLSIDDFMDIACEIDIKEATSTQDNKMSLQEMISQAMIENGIPQEAVEASLVQQVLNNIGNISLEKFRAIQNGSTQQASVEELRLIVNAVDPEQEIFSWWDWEAHATENPAQHWQGQTNNHMI